MKNRIKLLELVRTSCTWFINTCAMWLVVSLLAVTIFMLRKLSVNIINEATNYNLIRVGAASQPAWWFAVRAEKCWLWRFWEIFYQSKTESDIIYNNLPIWNSSLYWVSHASFRIVARLTPEIMRLTADRGYTFKPLNRFWLPFS